MYVSEKLYEKIIEKIEEYVNDFEKFSNEYFSSTFHFTVLVINTVKKEIWTQVMSNNEHFSDPNTVIIYQFPNQQDFANSCDIPCYHEPNFYDKQGYYEDEDGNEINEHNQCEDFLRWCLEHFEEQVLEHIEVQIDPDELFEDFSFEDITVGIEKGQKEAKVYIDDHFEKDLSALEPAFSERLYKYCLEKFQLTESQVSNFRWEGNQMNKSLEITIDLHHAYKQERNESGRFTSDTPKRNVIRVTDEEKEEVELARKNLREFSELEKVWETIKAYKKYRKHNSNARVPLQEGFYYVLCNPESYKRSYVAVWQQSNFWDGSSKYEPVRLGSQLPKDLVETKDWYEHLLQFDFLMSED